jgi:hypothetical protein
MALASSIHRAKFIYLRDLFANEDVKQYLACRRQHIEGDGKARYDQLEASSELQRLHLHAAQWLWPDADGWKISTLGRGSAFAGQLLRGHNEGLR